ncbi:metallophosphoesterase family protein [Butyrivibrio sp. AE3006]|uniref:metallophosphoesterase family protein n=1 Tax=Butyrivibrio sp. AE3006 TaxID=1280673 RepID=UPI00041D2BE8|nr:metallophosphoesterase [Butyrivibrio sp. AE3006]
MKKQIGVIGDIHSNYTAFKTAVQYMTERGITEFILLGDYVSDTTDTAETMQYIYELIKKYKVTAIRGNREDYLLGQRRVLRGESDAPLWLYNSASGNLLYTYELLTNEDLDFFESLPISYRYKCEGYPDIICCHGSPVNNRELLLFHDDTAKKWLEKIDADYIVGGHTHVQGECHHNGKHYFNTGSTGIAISAPGLAQCLILHGFDENEPEGPSWEAEFLNLPYDVDYVIDALYEKGLMEKGKWFVVNNEHILKTGKDVTPELINKAMILQEKETGNPVDWPYIEEEYFTKAAKILGIPDYRVPRKDAM